MSAETQRPIQRPSEQSAQRTSAWRQATPVGPATSWLPTAALGALYLVLAPSTADLAAASYRSYLFAHVGFGLWDNAWYAGHHLPAYSVLAPALGALLGPRLLAALSATLAAVLFARLIQGRFPPRATRLAGAWFAVGAGVELFSGRVPFDLGLALGLGALLAAAHRRSPLALLPAVLTALASPVAGAFLALAALAWALGDTRRSRAWPALLAVAALLPILLLAIVFPEGGSEPFAGSAFWPAFAVAILFAIGLSQMATIDSSAGTVDSNASTIDSSASTAANRALLVGALLYALALAGAYVLSTPVGGNAVRLGALTAGPLAACLLGGQTASDRSRRLLLAATPFLLYWQLVAPIHDVAGAAGDPSVNASYYTPLIERLERYSMGSDTPARIEVLPTRNHWEARWMAPRFALARGWERQLDRKHDSIFYSARPLTPARYRAWLLENAVAYVALPDATLDPSARAERRLLAGIGSQASGLREVWRSPHWRLFAVQGARPLAQAPAVLRRLGSDSFTLEVPHPGAYRVGVHFTPYWTLADGHGCIRRTPGDWTEVDARGGAGPASLRIVIHFSLTRVLDDGPRCR